MWPATDWSFVGRSDDVDLVAEAVLGGTSVVITGPAGIGKTTLAVRAARAVGEDEPVVVRSTEGLSRTPLAALVTLLEHLAVPRSRRHDPGAVVSSAFEALDSADHPVVVVLDDAPRLDPMSAEVVQQVMHHRSMQVLMTARDGEPLPSVLDHTLDEGLALRMPLGPLGADDAAAMASMALGSRLSEASAVELVRVSGGNPLFLRELLAGTVEANGFRQVPGGVELTRAVPSSRLVDLVAARFARCDEDQIRILEELAVAQPLPLAAYSDRPDSAALVSLEATGLVMADETEVRLGHPVYSEVLRSAVPPLRRRSRLEAAIAALRSSGSTESEFRATCIAVEADLPVDIDGLISAAHRSLGLLDYELAATLAERAVLDGAQFDGYLVLGGASSALGDCERASAAFASAGTVAHCDEQQARLAQRLGMHLAVRQQDPVAALDVAEAALDALTDPRSRQFLAADVIKWRLMAGRDLGDLVDEGVGEGDGAPGAVHTDDIAAALNRDMIQALMAVMAGDLDVADRAIERSLPLALDHPEVLPNAQDLLMLSRFLERTFNGEVPAATAFARQQLEVARRERAAAVGMWAYALGVTSLYCGRASEAVAHAEVAVEQLAWRDFTGLGPSARALSAAALAQSGRVAAAAEALTLLAASDLDDPKVDLLVAQTEMWLAAAGHDTESGAARLVTAVERGVSLQHGCLAALAAHELVRLGRAELVLEPLDVAASSGAELMALLADSARAAASNDAGAMEAVSVRLQSAGLLIAAADCSAQVARLHRRRGRGEAARRAHLRSLAVAEGCDSVRGAGGGERDVGLTPREREVAQLASERLRSREIAERLGISARTVDNHLASVYRKLGVPDRVEMSEVLADAGLIGGPPVSRASGT